MKGMKGRFLKKLRFITSVSTLKQGPVLHQNLKQDHKSNDRQDSIFCCDPKDDKLELESDLGNKERITPSIVFEDTKTIVQHEYASELEHEIREDPSFSQFEEKCPPGGEDSVIFYTTSLRGVRETSEACNRIRFLLETLKVMFHERDVSMDLEFREEMRKLLGDKVIAPRLFIKGRYIGGADEVVELNEHGKLKKLLEGIPSAISKCDWCENERFLICSTCNGSSRVFGDEEGDEMKKKCSDCNENGLVKCSICS